jgi:hypothetical protein
MLNVDIAHGSQAQRRKLNVIDGAATIASSDLYASDRQQEAAPRTLDIAPYNDRKAGENLLKYYSSHGVLLV